MSSSSSLLIIPNVAAAIDPFLIKNLRIEGDDSGAATQLEQIAVKIAPILSDVDNVPFEKSFNGASFRDYRKEKDEATVTHG